MVLVDVILLKTETKAKVKKLYDDFELGCSEYDDLISQQAPVSLNKFDRYTIMAKAEAVLLENMPIIPIYIYNSKSLVHPSVKGIEPNILNYVLYKNIRLDSTLIEKEVD